MNKLGLLRKMFFGLPLSEANFEVRGFKSGENAQARLELVAKTVVHGYNMAIETGLSDELISNRQFIGNELCGFYNEGIGMGLYTLDLFGFVNKNRFWDFIKGAGKNHEYMSYIGAGLACGVFNSSIKKLIEKASPTCGLLVINGLGFYYAYFKPNRIFDKNFIPKMVQADPFYVECYDNGIGRALWFYNGGNADKIAQSMNAFPKYRQAGVWSGVGLAATYAGGVEIEKIRRLKTLAGEFHISLGEGSILAVHTRDIAQNPHQENETVRLLTGRSVQECCSFALQAYKQLHGRRLINNKHSLQVFFEDIREWLRLDPNYAIDHKIKVSAQTV